MEQFYQKDKIEVGIDEAGRGCLFGPVSVASVIWPQTEPDSNIIIRDSKKMTERQKNIAYDYIMKNAISVSHKFIHNDEIDKTNILKSTIRGMHLCLDDITKDHKIDTILVDGNQFDFYCDCNDNYINHVCVVEGDNKYRSIACASVIAKVNRDNYIKQLCEENPILKEYDIHNNKGYGTARHLTAIKEKNIVETITVDELTRDIDLKNRILIIKIDVEGNDLNVLAGAQETINKFKPFIIIEFSRYIMKNEQFNYDFLVSFLKKNNYQIYNKGGNKLEVSDIIKLIENLDKVHNTVGNYYLISENNFEHKDKIFNYNNE